MKPALTAVLTIAIAVFGAFELQAHSEGSAAETTIIVVRHAEKVSTERDPVLSDEGHARARTLAHVLGDSGVDAIYTTQYLRTRQTAEPLAEKLGIEANVMEASADHIEELATRIRTGHRGQTVLVVGHSNTVPAILAALGSANPGPMSEDEYDHLYIVTLGADDSAHLLELRYGTEGASGDHAARVKR